MRDETHMDEPTERTGDGAYGDAEESTLTRRRRLALFSRRLIRRSVVAASGGADALVRRSAGVSARGKKMTLAILVVLLVVMSSAAAFLGWRTSQAAATERAGTEALQSARTKLPIVLSYKSETIKEDRDRARQQIAGTFASRFEHLTTNLIVPSVRNQGISTTAKVVRAAVITATHERVETLLFVNQETKSRGDQEPERTASAVKVEMSRIGGQWLISKVTPV